MDYFLYFIIYSFLGWLLEVVGKLVEDHKFINRGFLIGPICPIYGVSILVITLLIGKPSGDILSIFLKSILICSIFEYFTSYIMEKLFKARWWDYSRRKYNINGRICLEMMIPFGIISTFVVYIINPFITNIVLSINSDIRLILSIIFLIIFIIDNILSFVVMSKIKNQIKSKARDNTEIIKEKVLEWFDQNSILYRRIKVSYPNFKIKLKNLKENIEKTTNELINKL